MTPKRDSTSLVCPTCGLEELAEVWGVSNSCGDSWHWPTEREAAERELAAQLAKYVPTAGSDRCL